MTRVILTGASGFVAKHILRELLEQGYNVRASVRSESRRQEVQELFPESPIEFVFLDLTKDDGWTEAMQGCDVLVHTASPFPMGAPKDPQDLIGPAVDGTKRALTAAKDAGIRRVILTSSNAAIYKDAAKPKDAPSDESNWTTPDDPSVALYEASKTLAESAAWDFAVQNPEIALTTINPGLVFGPPMDGRYGTSLAIIERIMRGGEPFVAPIAMPVVDVRDVATMHVSAIQLDAASGERFSATADTLRFLEMSQILRDWDPDLKTPKRELPFWLMRLLAPFMPELKTIIGNVGRNLSVSGAKAEATFGLRFIPARDAIIASAEALKRA